MKTINLFDLPYPQPDQMTAPPRMIRTITHDGRLDPLPFLHDLTLASHCGTVYEAWYNSTSAEICGSSLIRGRFSTDEGASWSTPFCMVGEAGQSEEHYVPADLFVHNGRLYALVTTMTGKNMTVDLQLFEQTPNPMAPWERMGKVSEGFICNTPPQRMSNGCYIVGAWMPKKEQTPAFPVVLVSDGENIDRIWNCHFLFDPLHPLSPRIRCPEISVLVDGACVTAFVRNDEGPSFVFTSADYGKTWSEPAHHLAPIGNSKIFAGRLSDGRPYLVYNHDLGYFVRSLLVLAIGDKTSGRFVKVYKLFSGYEESLGRGNIWFYPCACEQNGDLYVAATLQEPSGVRSAVMAKMPIQSL